MKQKKGKEYKMTRQGTNENRIEKKNLKINVETGIIKGEFNEDKLITSTPENKEKK